MARAAERCGDDYQLNYDVFIEVAVGGDCGNVARIRDMAALYDRCLPTFQTIGCEDFEDANLDDSCREQLQPIAGPQG